ESFEPDRITLSLVLGETIDKKQAIKASGKKQATKTVAYREAIVEYLTENVSAKCSELSALIGISDTRTRAVLSKMIDDNILVAEGENRNRIYKLKA
ncbi:MAG: AAA family ATPase, partial [Oscillospiraceae bacterium]|nr:AAA family ATPase [Oscillospiraceae bacterium]